MLPSSLNKKTHFELSFEEDETARITEEAISPCSGSLKDFKGN